MIYGFYGLADLNHPPRKYQPLQKEKHLREVNKGNTHITAERSGNTDNHYTTDTNCVVAE